MKSRLEMIDFLAERAVAGRTDITAPGRYVEKIRANLDEKTDAELEREFKIASGMVRGRDEGKDYGVSTFDLAVSMAAMLVARTDGVRGGEPVRCWQDAEVLAMVTEEYGQLMATRALNAVLADRFSIRGGD